MIKFHEQKRSVIAQQNPSSQLTKISSYRQLNPKQRQQVISLKMAMSELKNENQKLKDLAYNNQKSKCTIKRQIAQKYSYTLQQLENKDDIINHIQNCQNKQINNTCLGTQRQKNNQKQIKNKSKNYHLAINQHNNKDKLKMLINPKTYANQSEGNNLIYNMKQQENYQPSTGRRMSRPQLNYNSSQAQKISNKALMLECEDVQSKFDYSHLTAKNKLIDNLVADLRYEIQQKNQNLAQQKSSHKNTKKSLKKSITQNEKLTQMNNKLLINTDYLQKQNQYLKQQIIKQTQTKYQSDTINNQIISFCNTTAKKYCQEFQLECLAMDAIYCDFQRIFNANTHA